MSRLLLNGEWKLSGKNKNKEYKLKTNIPGDFHTALLNEKIIPDPFYGFNEQEVLWVGKTDWIIEREFEYKKLPDTKAVLEFSEADTFFTLYINDVEVGKGQNQFARHRFDVSNNLKDGKNTIKILFESSERRSIEIAKSMPYVVPYSKYDVYSPDRNMTRKCQCHGGWDWGPCIMVSGIYNDIYIDTVDCGIFDDVRVFYSKKDDLWTAKFVVGYTGYFDCSKKYQITLAGKNVDISKDVTAEIKPGRNQFEFELQVENPVTWKTSSELKEINQLENTPYTFTISDGNNCVKKNIYFSTLKLISEKDFDEGKPGRSIYFENNGRKLFARGSNWIPCESLPSKMTAERYKDLLLSAVKANQNCIRVWGGGIYEKDCFYDLCDQYGLIVWQDCMFACSLYPMTPDFIEEVKKELDYQIPRLQAHACIGIWCGNNENFGALNWYPEARENKIRYLIDYDRLTNGVIGTKIKEWDPSRVFWPSSPSSGPDDYADNWHSDNTGDMHYWSVWHERKSFDAYQSIRPRFVSEFGYESFPSMDTIRSFAEEKDFNFTSKMMEYHQRSPIGNSIILENFSRYFKFPNGFENMVYLSQVQQALAIKTAVEFWRSLRPHCMGAIVWQLNDIWPGPSWSSLEYSGKWKLLQYAEKRFFNNVYIPLYEKDGNIHLSLCNDSCENLDCTFKIQFLRFDGSDYKAPVLINETVNADTTKEVFTESVEKDYSNEYFVYVSMEAASKSGKKFCCNNTLFVDLYKHCDISCSPEIHKTVKETPFGFEIELEAKEPAFFVSVDIPNVEGIFSDNMITLIPGVKQTLTFESKGSVLLTKNDFENNLIVKSLYNSFN